MHLINGLIRFTRHSYQNLRSCFFNYNDEPVSSERTALLLSAQNTTEAASVPSLTGDYEDFAHSYEALRLCIFHVTVYYTAAVLGFSFLVEQWSIIDSLYFGTVVWCTIGYGDVSEGIVFVQSTERHSPIAGISNFTDETYDAHRHVLHGLFSVLWNCSSRHLSWNCW